MAPHRVRIPRRGLQHNVNSIGRHRAAPLGGLGRHVAAPARRPGSRTCTASAGSGATSTDNEKESIPSCAREQRTLAMGDVAGDRSE